MEHGTVRTRSEGAIQVTTPDLTTRLAFIESAIVACARRMEGERKQMAKLEQELNCLKQEQVALKRLRGEGE